LLDSCTDLGSLADFAIVDEGWRMGNSLISWVNFLDCE